MAEAEAVTVEERLLAKLEELVELLRANERDRELSPYWRHADGSPVTRKECEVVGNPFEGPVEGVREALIAAAPNGVSVGALDAIKRRFG
jgi:hypothetical protein